MAKLLVAPNDWLSEISLQVNLDPKVVPENMVITQEVVQKFELLESRAMAHAKARGEHEALLYLTFYYIWDQSLYRAKYDTWENYCLEWDHSPFGVSMSSIKHKIADIKKMMIAGLDQETMIKALGNIPMAMRNIMSEAVTENDTLNPDMAKLLPDGMTVSDYISELAELSPTQAGIAVNELMGKPSIRIVEIKYIQDDNELLAKARHVSTVGVLEADIVVTGVPEWLAPYLMSRLKS